MRRRGLHHPTLPILLFPLSSSSSFNFSSRWSSGALLTAHILSRACPSSFLSPYPLLRIYGSRFFSRYPLSFFSARRRSTSTSPSLLSSARFLIHGSIRRPALRTLTRLPLNNDTRVFFAWATLDAEVEKRNQQSDSANGGKGKRKVSTLVPVVSCP